MPVVPTAGSVLMVKFGKIGSDGVQQIEQCASASGAREHVQSKLKEKLRKGYKRVDKLAAQVEYWRV